VQITKIVGANLKHVDYWYNINIFYFVLKKYWIYVETVNKYEVTTNFQSKLYKIIDYLVIITSYRKSVTICGSLGV